MTFFLYFSSFVYQFYKQKRVSKQADLVRIKKDQSENFLPEFNFVDDKFHIIMWVISSLLAFSFTLFHLRLISCKFWEF